MASLYAIIESAKVPHNRANYTPGRDHTVSTLSQAKWASWEGSKRMGHFKDKNVHLRNPPGSEHPTPICPDITSWDERRFASYFDILSRVEGEDQSWIPEEHFPIGEADYALNSADIAMNVPRRMLYDRLKELTASIPVPLRPRPYKDITEWSGILSQLDKQRDPAAAATVSVRVLEEQYSSARDRLTTIEQFLFSLKRTEELSVRTKHTTAGVVFLKHIPFQTRLPTQGLDSTAPIHASNYAVQTFTTDPPYDDMTFAQLMSPTAMARTPHRAQRTGKTPAARVGTSRRVHRRAGERRRIFYLHNHLARRRIPSEPRKRQ